MPEEKNGNTNSKKKTGPEGPEYCIPVFYMLFSAAAAVVAAVVVHTAAAAAAHVAATAAAEEQNENDDDPEAAAVSISAEHNVSLSPREKMRTGCARDSMPGDGIRRMEP